VFDVPSNAFYVNISAPPQIVKISADDLIRPAKIFEIPVSGPHGMDIDSDTQRLFCACDGGKLVTLDMRSGAVLSQLDISGVPDVIFYNARLRD
jgi:hypothetical protein